MTARKRRLLILIGTAISVFFLWYALRGTHFGEIGDALAKAQWWWSVPMLAAYCVFYWVKAIRWRMLLQPMVDTSAAAVFSPMMIGFLFNNILPAHLGEFVRMYLGSRQLELNNSQVLATIVLERVFDMLAVIFLFAMALLVAKDVDEHLILAGWLIAAAGVVFLVFTAIYVVRTEPFLAFLRRVTFFVTPIAFLEKARDGVLHQLEIGVAGLHALKNPRLLVGIIVTSIVQWGLLGLSAYCAILAVGVDVHLSAAFVVLAATTFAVTLPAAPGFLGSIQVAFTAALGPYGISKASAFAASAFFHVPTYLIVTLPGLWLLKRTGYKLKQVRSEAEAAAGK